MLQRRKYPYGFFVVALVEESDAACTGEAEGEPEPDPEWLWEAALNAAGGRADAQAGVRSRRKVFTVSVEVSFMLYSRL